MSENLEYIQQEQLLQAEVFATGPTGYIEEQVDEWVKKAITSSEEIATSYNNMVYRVMVAEARTKELEEGVTPVETDTTEFTEQISRLEAENANLNSHLIESQAYNTQAHERILELEAELSNVVVPVAAEPDATTDIGVARERSQRILDEANNEAKEHVSRAIERVYAIVSEAEEEAAGIVANAESEAEAIKEQATADASEARKLAEKINREQNEILTRLSALHSTHLEDVEKLKEKINLPEEEESIVEDLGYSNDENNEDVVVEETHEEVVEETVSYDDNVLGETVVVEKETVSYDDNVLGETVVVEEETVSYDDNVLGETVVVEEETHEEVVEENVSYDDNILDTIPRLKDEDESDSPLYDRLLGEPKEIASEETTDDNDDTNNGFRHY